MPGHSPSCCPRTAAFPWLTFGLLLCTHGSDTEILSLQLSLLSLSHPHQYPAGEPSPLSSCPTLQLRDIGAILPMAGVGRGEAGAHFSFNLEGRQMAPGRADCWCSSALCPSCLEQYFAAELGPAGAVTMPCMCWQCRLGEISRIWQRRARGQTFFLLLKKKEEAKEPLI